MSARDKVHYQAVNALVKDGWTITHDPLKVRWKKRRLKVDLGAERLLAAQKGTEQIAVEIKNFISKSDLDDLYNALGQFLLYQTALQEREPQRTLYLALDEEAYRKIFDDAEGETLRLKAGMKLLVFNKETEEIVLWKQ